MTTWLNIQQTRWKANQVNGGFIECNHVQSTHVHGSLQLQKEPSEHNSDQRGLTGLREKTCGEIKMWRCTWKPEWPSGLASPGRPWTSCDRNPPSPWPSKLTFRKTGDLSRFSSKRKKKQLSPQVCQLWCNYIQSEVWGRARVRLKLRQRHLQRWLLHLSNL